MEKITTLTRKWWPVVALVLVEAVLFVTNFKPGTYLYGWDNTVPELNLRESLIRTVFGVWQEYRGLGLLDGMAHAANLLHWVYVWILSWVLPQNLIRYVFISLGHVLGGVGVYKLIRQLLSGSRARLLGFLGAMFYMLNFGVIQMFYVPLELFVVHFALLPWGLWALVEYLDTGSYKDLLVFGLVNLMGVSQAHVPIMAVVYALAVIVFLTAYPLERVWRRKRAVLVMSVLVAVNVFWGLPYVYSTFKNAKVISEAKINQMTTEEVFLRNKAFGDFESVALMRSFNLDYIDFQELGGLDYLMKPWLGHIDSPLVLGVTWLFFILSAVGLINVVRRRRRKFYPVVAVWVFCFLMLGNDIPVLGLVSAGLRAAIPFFHQAFRFTFTKFIFVYALSCSLLLAVGVEWLVSRLGDQRRGIGEIFIIGVIIGLIGYAWPAFQGDFYYDRLRVKVPVGYFELINFFKHQDRSERIAILPTPVFWGWTVNDWGHRGSGFIWQGVVQPMLDRAFDPWSKQNEQYYWEVNTAVESRETMLLEAVIDKYQVKWLLFDESIVDTASSKPIDDEKLEAFLKSSDRVNEVERFGDIVVYKVVGDSKVSKFVFSPNKVWANGGKFDHAWMDTGFVEKGHYYQADSLGTRYLFPSLFTNKQQADIEFGIRETESYIKLTPSLTGVFGLGGKLVLPNYAELEALVPAKLVLKRADGLTRLEIDYLLPEFWVGGERLVDWPSDSLVWPVGANEGLITVNGRENFSLQGEGSRIEIGQVYLSTKLPNLIEFVSSDLSNSFSLEYFVPTGLFEVDPVEVDQVSQVTVVIPKIKDSFDFDLVEIYGGVEAKSCLAFSEGEFERSLGEEGITYRAIDSSSCQGFPLAELLHNQGYLLSVIASHISGLPLKMSLRSRSFEKPVINTFLTASREIAPQWLILPPTEEFNIGYDLDVDTFSLGREVAENLLASVVVRPFPYGFLKRVRVDFEGKGQFLRQLEVVSVDHPNPAFYRVNVKTSEEGLLVLGQGYESGWVARARMEDGSRVWLDGHVLVNNWANGWKVPEGAKEVTIFYWPQLLEFVGFGLLIVTGIWLVYKYKFTTK